jgi:heme/copper-type cytochrome/quinol oxidase subunit 2
MVVLMKMRRSSLRRPAVLALVAAVAGVVMAAVIWRPELAAQQQAQVIEISAERFSFYPSEIKVKAGTRLEIRLTSEDTMHGFHIVGTDVDVELPKRGRGVATVMFQPAAGRYTFECSRLCGAGHSFMRGVIIAAE